MANILIIDDDANTRALLKRVLEGAGHEVDEAVDGVQGTRSFQRRRPDLIFCDLLMPEKEGIQTIQELRASDARVPIVAMSGGVPHLLSVAVTLGASAALRKPFDLRALLGMVAKLLGMT